MKWEYKDEREQKIKDNTDLIEYVYKKGFWVWMAKSNYFKSFLSDEEFIHFLNLESERYYELIVKEEELLEVLKNK
jgi:hypothetical protein